VFSFGGDGESVNFISLGAVKHANGLAIEAVPIGDLAVGASSNELGLVGVVDNGLEHGGLEEAHDTGVGDQIPNDAAAVVGSGNGLRVIIVDLDLIDATTVLLKRGLHNLGLAANSPETNLTFLTTGNDALAIAGGAKSGNSVVVSIIDGVQELSGLGKEGTNFTVGPT